MLLQESMNHCQTARENCIFKFANLKIMNDPVWVSHKVTHSRQPLGGQAPMDNFMENSDTPE